MATGKSTAKRAREYEEQRTKQQQAEKERYKRLYRELYMKHYEKSHDILAAKEATRQDMNYIYREELRQKQLEKERMQQLAQEVADKVELNAILYTFPSYFASLSAEDKAELIAAGEDYRQTVRETNIERYGTPC